MTNNSKEVCRAKLKQVRENLPPAYIDTANAKIEQRVFGFAPFINAGNLCVYISTPWEPRTSGIIENALNNNKCLYVPVCVSRSDMIAVRVNSATQFAPNRFGIPEPIGRGETMEPALFDFIIVPCVSADLYGGRLGHGAGYYDRFLRETKAVKLCLCYDALLSDKIPMDALDVPMDYIITESKTVSCR